MGGDDYLDGLPPRPTLRALAPQSPEEVVEIIRTGVS